MSYDLQVWSVKPFQQNAFRQPEMWQKESGAWTHAHKNWQIVVSASDRVVPEDVPDDVSKLLPGIEWLTNLNLEGKPRREPCAWPNPLLLRLLDSLTERSSISKTVQFGCLLALSDSCRSEAKKCSMFYRCHGGF